jgi:Flavin-binding monooxygenase-like
MAGPVTSATQPRICVIGAGPCGLTAVKNLLQVGCGDVICFEEGSGIGGNWAFTDDPQRVSVYAGARAISSRRLSAFDDFPMPDTYPDFPSHQQLFAYFTAYARAFRLERHIRLDSRVTHCALDADGRWAVGVTASGVARVETFDAVVVCSGHHREPLIPEYPGSFTGAILHSSAYKRPDRFRGQRVLVVGAGNSAADIAVEVGAVAARTALSMREGAYVFPRLVLGRPADVHYNFWQGRVPRRWLRSALRLWLRLAIGRWEAYGLQRPTHAPLEKHPIVNSGLLDAVRGGGVVVRPGIDRYDGQTVCFANGVQEPFDSIVMATGFRIGFPFLPTTIAGWDMAATPPLYLKMMHPTVSSLFFIGLFQPIGCVWRLAEYQTRIAALQIVGQLPRPPDIAERIRREVGQPQRRHDASPRRAIEVDHRAFRRELLSVLGAAEH